MAQPRPPRRSNPLFPTTGGGEGALFGVMTIMSFLACLTLTFALGTARLAKIWQQGLSGQATVQIVEQQGMTMDAQIAAAMTVLEATPGIASSTQMSADESAALLRTWLGDADLSVVPVPMLISVTLDPATPLDSEMLREKLKTVAPGASFDDHSRWNAGLTSTSATLSWTAYMILALIALATAAAVIFAARAALLAHREVVDVLHMIGARTTYIAHEVQARFVKLGFQAGLAGATGAVLVGVIMKPLIGAGSTLGVIAPIWSDVIWLMTVPVCAAIVSMLTARIAVFRFLAPKSWA